MIALRGVENPDAGEVIARHAEAHRVRSGVCREMRTAAASVPQIAPPGHGLFVGEPGMLRVGAAGACVKIAEAAAQSRQALAGIKVGTRHGRYSSIGR